jgi:hypothetical protein
VKWVTASERQFGIVWLLDSFRSFPQGTRVLALPFPDGGDDFVIAVRVSGTYDGSRPHDFDRQDLIQYWERAIEDILSKPAGNGLVWKWEEDKDGTSVLKVPKFKKKKKKKKN